MELRTMHLGKQTFIKQAHKKIKTITVQEAKEGILGIAILFENFDGTNSLEQYNMCQTALSKLYYYVWETSFEIQQHDFIQEISASIEGTIKYIEFSTYLGQKYQVGQKIGITNSISSYGDSFNGIGVAFDSLITGLSFSVQPLSTQELKFIESKISIPVYPTQWYPQGHGHVVFNYPQN